MSLLQIKNITVVAEGKEVVRDVSFSIPSGEVHVLVGSNGSGKSSLVNALFGHPKYKITQGNILLDGEDITHLSPDKKAKRGLFLSLQHLPEIDGVTFLNFLFRAYRELQGLPDLAITDFKKIFDAQAEDLGIAPDFFKRHVNAGLSGGEKKLSEVFQLALFEPKFAFLDEIDSGVDAVSLEKIFHTVSELKEKGTGFLLITHSEKMLEKIKPDRVYTMSAGKIV